MNNSWIKWPVLEAGAKTINRLLFKFIGSTGRTFAGAFFVSFVTSLVQTIVSLVFIKIKKTPFLPPLIIFSIFSGLVAVTMTFLSVATFNYEGADVGITTFFISMAVIPGAIIDRIIFKHKLNRRQIIGIILYIFTAYAFLDFPPLKKLLTLPTWVWISVGVAILMAVNENLTKKARELDPFVHQFWVGLSGAVLIGILLSVFNLWSVCKSIIPAIWIAILTTGAVVVFMIFFKIMSYKYGAYVALKSLLMQGSYIIMANLSGILLFHEPLTAGKIIGIFGFFIAYCLVDTNVYDHLIKTP